MGRFKFSNFVGEWWLPDFWPPGHPPPKATPSPTSPFAPCYGALSDNLHWERAQRKSARHSGFDGTSWHYLAAWQISHRTASNEDRPASFPGFTRCIMQACDNHLAYIASWGKNKPPPWLRLPPSTNPSSGRCGTLHCKHLASMPVVCRCAKRRGIRCKDSICYTIRVIAQGGKGGKELQLPCQAPGHRRAVSLLASALANPSR